MWANTVCVPAGEISTIVVPVPCRFELALKFETRVSPATRMPVLIGTDTMP